MINICTIFNLKYLYQGLSLYGSLSKNSSEFCWRVLCMDRETKRFMEKLDLPGVKLIDLAEIETDNLRTTRRERTDSEYCWTIKGTFMIHIFETEKNVESLLYVDSDMFFFSDPKKIFELMSKYSLGITPHRFPKNQKSIEKETGRYNAGIIFFRKDKIGLECLEKWSRQCIEWCYLKLEDGKFCDQMYLDQWSALYPGRVRELLHKGINLAPWNVGRYSIANKTGKTKVDDQDLILYHFHQFKLNSSFVFRRVRGYALSKSIIEHIYEPYEKSLRDSSRLVFKIKPLLWARLELSFMKSYLLSEYEIFCRKLADKLNLEMPD